MKMLALVMEGTFLALLHCFGLQYSTMADPHLRLFLSCWGNIVFCALPSPECHLVALLRQIILGFGYLCLLGQNERTFTARSVLTVSCRYLFLSSVPLIYNIVYQLQLTSRCVNMENPDNFWYLVTECFIMLFEA